MTDSNEIDPFSEYSLHNVVSGDIPPGESTEYMGFHIVSQGNGRFHAQLDGHAGSVKTLDSDDYDDVLGVVDDLNGLVIRHHEYDYQDDKDELVEWAGRIMTRDAEKAADDNYLHIPDAERA